MSKLWTKPVTFAEMRDELKKQPKPKFLWRGIKEKSFGIVFGPAKSGKSVFCENLAMSVAVGRKEYLDSILEGIPRKTLFIGLEEHWVERARRNEQQFSELNDEEQAFYNKNYMYQQVGFPSHIKDDNHWKRLGDLIKNSEAEVVVIDSITRLNNKKLEDSSNAEEITRKLRTIAHDSKVTLICIHHTHKLRDQELTMDSIKGSSTFAQEIDFAIGISKTSRGQRYFKDIVYRYAPADDQTAIEFEMTSNCTLETRGESEEEDLFRQADRRSSDRKKQMAKFFKENAQKEWQLREVIKIFISEKK